MPSRVRPIARILALSMLLAAFPLPTVTADTTTTAPFSGGNHGATCSDPMYCVSDSTADTASGLMTVTVQTVLAPGPTPGTTSWVQGSAWSEVWLDVAVGPNTPGLEVHLTGLLTKDNPPPEADPDGNDEPYYGTVTMAGFARHSACAACNVMVPSSFDALAQRQVAAFTVRNPAGGMLPEGTVQIGFRLEAWASSGFAPEIYPLCIDPYWSLYCGEVYAGPLATREVSQGILEGVRIRVLDGGGMGSSPSFDLAAPYDESQTDSWWSSVARADRNTGTITLVQTADPITGGYAYAVGVLSSLQGLAAPAASIHVEATARIDVDDDAPDGYDVYFRQPGCPSCRVSPVSQVLDPDGTLHLTADILNYPSGDVPAGLFSVGFRAAKLQYAGSPAFHTVVTFQGLHAEVVGLKTPPDLQVTALAAAPAVPAAGDTVTWTATVANPGQASAGAFDVRFLLDGSTVLGTTRINSLAGGATATASASWTSTAGTHTVTAIADAAQQVTEANEGNNERSASIDVAAPAYGIDLSPSSASASVPSRGTATFAIVVANTGTRTDTYSLSTSGARKGWTAGLDASTVTVAPGANTTVHLTVQAGTNGNLTVTVTAASAGGSSVAASGSYTVRVAR